MMAIAIYFNWIIKESFKNFKMIFIPYQKSVQEHPAQKFLVFIVHHYVC